MTALRRDAILGADDRPRERVEVPEWGGHVYVRSMSGTERDGWEASFLGDAENRGLRNARARLVVLCAVDEEGRRIFAEHDADALGEKSGLALDRVFKAAMRMNALGRAEVEKIAGE